MWCEPWPLPSGESDMANYKAMAERARKSAAAAKADGAQMLGLGVGAGVIGLMVKSGAMERLPDLGVPKTLIVAAVGKAVGYNMSGAIGQGANGAGNAAAVIAIFQFVTGQTVSGVSGASASGNSLDRERQLAAQLQRVARRELQSDNDPIGDLEALAEALPDRYAAE